MIVDEVALEGVSVGLTLVLMKIPEGVRVTSGGASAIGLVAVPPGLAARGDEPPHAVTSKLPSAINPTKSKLRFMRRQNSILRWRMMTLSAKPMARSMVMSELPP